MALAAVRHAGQKPNSSRYSQHQERPVFDLIRQFSECIATEALSFVRDRLAYTSRTFSYAAHDAIQSVVDELTNVIRDARRFAFRRTRQTAKPLLKVTYEILDRCHFFRSRGFARVVILHLTQLISLTQSQVGNVARGKMFHATEGLTAVQHALHSGQ
jgi:hypothetical protein